MTIMDIIIDLRYLKMQFVQTGKKMAFNNSPTPYIALIFKIVNLKAMPSNHITTHKS